ncbi:E3 ubiquitin-protein ligase Topors-like [Gadus chalcogrammus]|uniref:E3 ubiquitin-protein ligase Topors-like n=1 Tax=Gadus chalcogrammus TaxID=1042646 RepID=UPI0024C4CA16|nr:E3 ubiquitin-protein ligase Topors-like [Gadus chalcogrammus]
MAPTKMKLRVRRRESGAAPGEREVEVGGAQGGGGGHKKPPSPPAPSGDEEASPDSKCPICLDRFNNLAYLDRCLHRFCFPCIQEWSHNKAECPLCKQAFTSILHSVRSHDDFKEYTLRPPPPTNASLAATVAMRRAEAAAGLPLPPAPPPLPSPYSPDSPPPPGGEEPGDRGVLFEGLAGLGGAVGPGDRSARHLMSRLAARRRVQLEGGAPRRLREREMLAFRRALYRSGVRALLGNPGQQQPPPPPQDVSSEGFVRSPGQLARLRPWLRRELTVLYGAHGSLVDIVQRIITSRVTRHGLERTHGLEDELRPFLLARTQHFLHELAAFARSALSMERYDAQAVYEPLGPDARASPARRLSSSAHSSVIAISEGEEAAADGTAGLLSLATWDEDTPGPSYSTAEPAAPPSPAPPAAGGGGGVEDECLIVGYVKPMAERTPELVQLSSDTEEEPRDKPPKEEATERPAHPAPASPPGSPPPAWSCSSGSPRPPERGGRPPPHSPGGWEGGRRRRKKRRRRKTASGERERPSLYTAVYSGLDCPRSRSSSSSLPRSASSPDAARHSDKPGGKRKYKSRHLDEDGDPTWRPGSERGRRRERERRRDAHKHNSVCEDQSSSSSSSSSGGDGGHRSPSVEIIYEGKLGPCAPSGNQRRKKRRPHRRHLHNSSPVVITIDSQSSPDDGGHGNRLPVFSELAVRQPIDFSACDLPALQSLEPGRVGVGLGADVGELPVNILARGSDGSDTEANHQSKASDVLAVDISDDEDEDDEREGERRGEKRKAEDEGGASDGDESRLLATILDEIAQLNPGGCGQNSRIPLPWPGTKSRRRKRTMGKVEEGSGLTAPPPAPLADLPHTSETPAPDQTRPLEWTRPLCDPGPFPETRLLDGKRPLKWDHPLEEMCQPVETGLLEWTKPRPLSDHRRLEWTHQPALPRPLDRPHPLEWTPLPLNETAPKQEAAADQTATSLPVGSSNPPALSSSSEAPPPAVTSPVVNGVVNASADKLRPDRESSASPSLSPAPSQSGTSDRGPGQECLKLQQTVGPTCVSGAAKHTHITDFHME